MKGFKSRAGAREAQIRFAFPFIILYWNMLISAKTKYYAICAMNLLHELFSSQKSARKNSTLFYHLDGIRHWLGKLISYT